MLLSQQKEVENKWQEESGYEGSYTAISITIGKENLTYGTRLVWNSFRSTLRDPSKRRDAVIDETTWAIRRFRLVKLGCETPSFFLQIS